MSVAGAIGNLAGGLGRGMSIAQFRKDREEDRKQRDEDLDLRRQEMAARGTDFNPNAGGGVPASASRQGRSIGIPFDLASEPAAAEMAPYQKAFLDMTASRESGGRYNIRYDGGAGAAFDDYSQHPGIMVEGPEGPSSAAGRYQFTKSTWDDMGGGSFDPRSQDYRAWDLAAKRYRATTGGDLAGDLRENGVSEGMLAALSPTWAAFRANRGRLMSTYQARLQHYSEA